MRLSRKFDQALVLSVVLVVALFFGCLIKVHSTATFAEGEDNTYLETTNKHVTFYDEGKKLTVKTDASTVKEALDRAGFTINQGDIVEPKLDTKINMDNFFINIYRAHPVLVKDGATDKYIMTASYDLKTIASEAGFTIYDGDEIKQLPNTNFLEAGALNIYKITRNGGRTLTVEEEIAFKEETVKDYNLAPGTSEVRQLGEVGTKKVYYNVLYIDGKEVSREFVSEEIVREPVARITAVGASQIEKSPLTAGKGVNTYTINVGGNIVLRKETYYDLPMGGVMLNAARMCGVSSSYTVRADGAKVDADGYVLVAANLNRYPRCSVVETSLGPGKVYDTGGFAASNPEQFDLATDWSNHDGR